MEDIISNASKPAVLHLVYETSPNRLALQNETFGKDLLNHNYNSKLANSIQSPSDILLAQFCEVSYKEEIPCTYDEDWQLLTTAHNYSSEYLGIAFWNSQLCHIVVVHGGSYTPLKRKVGSLYFRRSHPNLQSYKASAAASFVHRILQEVQAISDSKFRISITGHSTGGWLAQVSAFTAQFLEVQNGKFVKKINFLDIHPHTVVFNGPGCRTAFEYLSKSYNIEDYNRLDMTVYIGRPNKDLTAHVGNIQVLHRKDYDKTKIDAVAEINDIINLIDYLTSFSPSKDKPKKLSDDRAPEKVQIAIDAENILNNEHQRLESKLKTFTGFHFSDKYDLEKFLSGDCQVLHIKINVPTLYQYIFELEVLNNIIQFHRKDYPEHLNKGNYVFVAWKNVCKWFFGSQNLTLKYKFVIIENFENVEAELLDRFVSQIQTKAMILVTTGSKYSDKDLLLTKPQVSSLNEESQKEFLEAKYLKLNEDFLSWNDVKLKTDWAFPLQTFRQLLTKEMIELNFNPETGSFLDAVFTTVHRELEDTKYLQKLSKNSVYIVSDNSKEQWFNISATRLEKKQEFKQHCNPILDQAKYLFKMEHGRLFLTDIFNPKFYIKRTLINTKKPLEWKLFDHDLISQNDRYVFFGNVKKYESNLKNLSENSRRSFHFANSLKEGEKLMKGFGTVNSHLFEINDEINWIYSYGSCDNILTNEDLMIISAGGGHGKTALIQYLSLWLRRDQRWILTIPLRNAYFNDFPVEVDTFDVSRFISNTCCFSYAGCVQPILDYHFKSGSQMPIYLLFDGFDEIFDEESRLKFIQIVNVLKGWKVKMLITTRPEGRRELESGLAMFAVDLNLVDFEQTTLYLKEFWSKVNCLFDDVFEPDNFTSVAKSLYQHGFRGIPKDVREIEQILSPSLSIREPTGGVENVLELYQAYIKAQWDDHFTYIDSSPNQQALLKRLMSKKLSNAALRNLLNLETDPADEELKELSSIGFVYLEKGEEYDFKKIEKCKFAYSYVSAFLVSKCLLCWFTSHVYIVDVKWDIASFLIDEVFGNDKYKAMRLFLNYHFQTLETDSYQKQLTYRKELCEEKLLTSEIQKHGNGNGESIMHICIKENLEYLFEKLILDICTDGKLVELLILRTNSSETPLWYAIKSWKEPHQDTYLRPIFDRITTFSDSDLKKVLVTTLFNCPSVSLEDIDRLINYSIENYKERDVKEVMAVKSMWELQRDFFDACKENSVDRINSVFGKVNNNRSLLNYLLNSTNELKQTGLHQTSSPEVAQIIMSTYFDSIKSMEGFRHIRRLIISFDFSELEDHIGMTPLAKAIKDGNFSMVHMLVGLSSYYSDQCMFNKSSRDQLGNTPFMQAAKYGHVDCMELIYSHYEDDDRDRFHDRYRFGVRDRFDDRDRLGFNNELLNSTNFAGLTPLMLSSKRGHHNLKLNFNLNYHPNLTLNLDLNSTNFAGLTPLMLSSKHGHLNCVKFLVRHNANVSIKDNNGFTAIFYAVINNDSEIFLILASHGASVNETNNFGLTPYDYVKSNNEDMRQLLRNLDTSCSTKPASK